MSTLPPLVAYLRVSTQSQADEGPEFLTRGQVAEVIGRTRRTVPRWTAARGIPRQRNERGWWLWPAEQVRAAIEPEAPVPAAVRLHRFIHNPLNWPSRSTIHS